MGMALTIVLSCLCGIYTVEGSPNLKLQVYETSKLCPDLQDSIIGKDESVFQLVKDWSSSELPCLLKSLDLGVRKKVALIAGIHADTRPWKFSSDANTCREHIKARLPKPKPYHPADSYHDLNAICRLPRKPELFVKVNVSNFGLRWFLEFAIRDTDYRINHRHKTPSLYYLGNRKLVITTHFNDSDLVFNEQQQKDFWFQPDHIHHSGTKYIQIIFIVRSTIGDCYVQMQQSRINNDEDMSCENLHQLYPFRLCGVYGCDEIYDILRVVNLQQFYNHSDEKTRQTPKTHQPVRPTTPPEPDTGKNILGFLVTILLSISGIILYVFRTYGVTSNSNPPHRHISSSGSSGIRTGNCNGDSDNVTVRLPPTTATVVTVVSEITDRPLHNRIRTSSDGGVESHIGNCNTNSDDVVIRPPTTETVVTNYDVIPLVQIGTEEEPPPSYDCLDKLPTYEEVSRL